MTRTNPLFLAALCAGLCVSLGLAGCDDGGGGNGFPAGPGFPDGEDDDGGSTTAPDDEPEPEPDDDEDEGDSSSGGEEPADHSALDAYILGLGHLDIDPIADKHQVGCNPASMECMDPWEEGGLSCEQRYYSETRHLDSFLAIQPDSPALWPGALLRGGDMDVGVLSQIGLERAPATFSLSLESLNDSPKATMEAPTLSEFRDLRSDILQGGTTGNTAAQLSYEIHRIFSKSQFSLAVGADFNWVGIVDVNAMYDFQSGEFSNKYLIDFTQTYYTADLDTPARPSDVFGEFVDVEDAQLYMNAVDPPMYVQSVSYGRRVLFAIESNDTLDVMVAAIDAAFGDGIAGVEVDVGSQEILNAAKITATVLGGNADDAVQTILGPENMIEYILEGGNYSADSPGVPIAYKVAYLDNAPARLALTATYPETHCE